MNNLIIWLITGFIIIELGVSFLALGGESQNNPLSTYFNYGLSTESKLSDAINTNDRDKKSLMQAGWFLPKTEQSDPTRPLIAVYGMSFSNHIAEIIKEKQQHYDVMTYAGPGAPLNHSYTYIDKHRPHKKGSIVILGILASSLPYLNALGHMTHSFEAPAAHLYPRYFLDDNEQLSPIEIDIHSFQTFSHALQNEKKWRLVKQTLADHDAFFYPTIFEHNLTDYSAFARLIKRALAQKHQAHIQHQYHDENGFTNHDRLIEISQYLVKDFAQKVRSDGAIPYIILFNNRGYQDHLYTTLENTLNDHNIPFYSTHEQFPSDNQANFIADGHFQPSIDEKIADAIITKLSILHPADRM